MEKRTSFIKSYGTTRYIHVKNESRFYTLHTHKNNSECITDINVKHKTYVKIVLEDNIRENLGDLGNGDDFLNTTQKAKSMKEISSLKLKFSTL